MKAAGRLFAALALWPCSSMAAPVDLARQVIGPWQLEAQEGESNLYCDSVADYDNGYRLSFGIYDSGAIDLGLTKKDWGLGEGTPHELDLRIDGFRFESLAATGYDNFLLFDPLPPELVERLARAKLLEVISGRNGVVFSLAAMDGLMARLRRCGDALAAGERPSADSGEQRDGSGSAFLKLARLAAPGASDLAGEEEVALPEGASLVNLPSSLEDMLSIAGLREAVALSPQIARSLFGEGASAWFDEDAGMLALLVALPDGEALAVEGDEGFIELVEDFCKGLSQSSLSAREVHVKGTLISGRNACEEDGKVSLWQFIIVLQGERSSMILLNADLSGGETLLAVSENLGKQLSALSRRLSLRR